MPPTSVDAPAEQSRFQLHARAPRCTPRSPWSGDPCRSRLDRCAPTPPRRQPTTEPPGRTRDHMPSGLRVDHPVGRHLNVPSLFPGGPHHPGTLLARTAHPRLLAIGVIFLAAEQSWCSSVEPLAARTTRASRPDGRHRPEPKRRITRKKPAPPASFASVLGRIAGPPRSSPSESDGSWRTDYA